jgi:hypothetical protein
MSPVGGEGTGEQSTLMGDRVKTRADEIETSVGAAPYDVARRFCTWSLTVLLAFRNIDIVWAFLLSNCHSKER